MKLPTKAVFATGIVLGITGDILLRGRGGLGINIFLLLTVLGIAIWMLGRRAGIIFSREEIGILAAGVALATAFVLRASPALQFFIFILVTTSFALPALKAGSAWLTRSGVSDQIEAVTVAAANAFLGSFRLAGAALCIGSTEAGKVGIPRSGSLTMWAIFRGRRERFAFPAPVSGYLTLALLFAINPDAWIA